MESIDDVITRPSGIKNESGKDVFDNFNTSDKEFNEFLASYGYEIRNPMELNLSLRRVRYEAVWQLIFYLEGEKEKLKISDQRAWNMFTVLMDDLVRTQKPKSEERVELQRYIHG